MMGVYGTLTVELSDDDRYPKGETIPVYLTTAVTPDPVTPVTGTLPPAESVAAPGDDDTVTP